MPVMDNLLLQLNQWFWRIGLCRSLSLSAMCQLLEGGNPLVWFHVCEWAQH